MPTSVERQALSLKGRVEAYERRLIMVALERAGGNQHRAALALGVRPTTLNEKLKRLGIGVVRHVVDLERPDPEERRRMTAALAESDGRIGRAAARLGLTRAKLREELRRLGIGLERSIENEARWPSQEGRGPFQPAPAGVSPRRGRRPAGRACRESARRPLPPRCWASRPQRSGQR